MGTRDVTITMVTTTGAAVEGMVGGQWVVEDSVIHMTIGEIQTHSMVRRVELWKTDRVAVDIGRRTCVVERAMHESLCECVCERECVCVYTGMLCGVCVCVWRERDSERGPRVR